MRVQMVFRNWIRSGLLIVLLLIPSVIASNERLLVGPNLYVRARAADCSKTKVIIKLEGVDPRPNNVMISIVNGETGIVEVKPTTVALEGDEYILTSLLSLGESSLSLVNGKRTFTQRFTNIKLVEQFQNQQSRLIQVRGGKGASRVPQTNNIREDIPIPAVDTAVRTIHLLLVGADNKLASQYIGNPITSWQVNVPEGTYKLVLVTYYEDSRGCRVESRRS